MKAGGSLTRLYLAWKHGHHDPYRLYHLLDEAYRPIGIADALPRHPAHPQRVRNVIFGFAVLAQEEALAQAAAGGVPA